jgi:hypothetical protein
LSQESRDVGPKEKRAEKSDSARHIYPTFLKQRHACLLFHW